VRWFDTVLKGAPADGDKPVQIFVMGKNVWRGEDDWPLARAHVTRYRLHAGGALGTGDPAATESPDSFVYDPSDPVPTRGGPLCCDDKLPAGAADQRVVEARKDVLLYSTPVFDHDVEVTGPVSVELFVSSSAKDTDFTAKLVDVWPNGFVQNLTEGIVRMRFRESREKPSLLEPGKVYPATIDLAGTSNVFLAGHAMRVEISSSNFPRFDRNLNVAESPERGARADKSQKATNRVYHDAGHPSALVVSIVPASGP
jgi:putative CocE/NonD family hydrolase